MSDPIPEVVKRKISKQMKGHIVSEATKKKISIAHKEKWTDLTLKRAFGDIGWDKPYLSDKRDINEFEDAIYYCALCGIVMSEAQGVCYSCQERIKRENE